MNNKNGDGMIINYKIELENNNEILYIFFDFSYEFGKVGSVKEEDIFSKILNYIKDKKIKFNGKKVMLCASGIVFATLLFSPITNNIYLNYNNVEVVENMLTQDINKFLNEDILLQNTNKELNEEVLVNNISNLNEENKTKENNYNKLNTDVKLKQDISEDKIKNENNLKEELKYENPVTIYRNNGEIVTLELEHYLIGVVAAEMPASFNIEALKAQAVAARTYALKYISEGKKLTDTEATQSYKDKEELKIKWGIDFNKYYQKIEDAVKSTEGVYMTYNGKYIDAVYHASNNGYTVSSFDVWGNDIPYLNSVESNFDINTSSYLREKIFLLEEFNQKLGVIFNLKENINIIKDETNHVKNVLIGNENFTGVEFRQKLGLRSTDFDIDVVGEKIKITTRGYGHAVGMSQYGANEMANRGFNYLDILNHYYGGIIIAI